MLINKKYNQTKQFQDSSINHGINYCPLMHVVTLLTTYKLQKIDSLYSKIEDEIKKLEKYNFELIQQSSYDALIQTYKEYIMGTEYGFKLLKILEQRINKHTRPIKLISILQLLSQQLKLKGQKQQYVKTLYKIFEIGLNLKQKIYKTFNFGMKSLEIMNYKDFQKLVNGFIVAIKNQIDFNNGNNNKLLAKNISLAEKVYKCKVVNKRDWEKNNGTARMESKENRSGENQYLETKRIVRNSTNTKRRNFSMHKMNSFMGKSMHQQTPYGSSSNQFMFSSTFSQTLGSKTFSSVQQKQIQVPYMKQAIKFKQRNQNQLIGLKQNYQSPYLQKNHVQPQQNLKLKSSSKKHRTNSKTLHFKTLQSNSSQLNLKLFSKAKPKLKTKNQLLPYYILLYEIYCVCVLRFRSEIKKKYFNQYKQEVKQKIVREYPGRNIQQILFDVELEKLRVYENLNEIKWVAENEEMTKKSTVVKYNNKSTKNSPNKKKNQNEAGKENVYQNKHKSTINKNALQVDYQIDQFEESTQSVNVKVEKENKRPLSSKMKGFYRNVQYNSRQKREQQIFEKEQNRNQKLVQLQISDNPFKNVPNIEQKIEKKPSQSRIRSRKVISRSQHKSSRQILQLQNNQNIITLIQTKKSIKNLQISNKKLQITPNNDQFLLKIKKEQLEHQKQKKSSGLLKKKVKGLINDRKFIKNVSKININKEEIVEEQKVCQNIAQNTDVSQKNVIDVKEELKQEIDVPLQDISSNYYNELQKQVINQTIKKEEQEEQKVNETCTKEENKIQTKVRLTQVQSQEAQGYLNELYQRCVKMTVQSSQQSQQELGNEQQEQKSASKDYFDEINQQESTNKLQIKQTFSEDKFEKDFIMQKSDRVNMDNKNQEKSSSPEAINPKQQVERLQLNPNNFENQTQNISISVISTSRNPTTKRSAFSQQKILTSRNRLTNRKIQEDKQNGDEDLKEKQGHLSGCLKNQVVNDTDFVVQEENNCEYEQNKTSFKSLKDRIEEQDNLEEDLVKQNQQDMNSQGQQSDLDKQQSQDEQLITEQGINYLTQLYCKAQIQQTNKTFQVYSVEKAISDQLQKLSIPKRKSRFSQQHQQNSKKSQKLQQIVEQYSLQKQKMKQENTNENISQGSIESSQQIQVQEFDGYDTLAREYLEQLYQEICASTVNWETELEQIRDEEKDEQSENQNIKGQQQVHEIKIKYSERKICQNGSLKQLEENQDEDREFKQNLQLNESYQLPLQQKGLTTQKVLNERSSIQDSLAGMANLLRNSLINSNNLLSSNNAIQTRKSIMKSDSKIRNKNTSSNSTQKQNNLNNQTNKSQNGKKKEVKIAIVPREQTISTANQSYELIINQNLLKPHIKVSENLVSLTIFHPYQSKISYKYEKQFIRPINVNLYAKGLQSRILKQLNKLLEECEYENQRGSRFQNSSDFQQNGTKKSISKSNMKAVSQYGYVLFQNSLYPKESKPKKTRFNSLRSQSSAKSTINWELITKKLSEINLQSQLVNLKSLKIQYKRDQYLRTNLMHYVQHKRLLVQYKKNPIDLRSVQISLTLNESLQDIKNLFNQKNIKVQLSEQNNEIKPILQVYNLWCIIQNISISLKNSTSKLKSQFKLNQFVYKSQDATKYNLLIQMIQHQGQFENVIVSDLDLEKRNKFMNNFSIIIGFAVKIVEKGKAKFVCSGKEIREFLECL